MITEQMRISYTFDNGRCVSTTISGQASLDDVLDTFRGLLVSIGYPTHIAERLQIVEVDDRGAP